MCSLVFLAHLPVMGFSKTVKTHTQLLKFFLSFMDKTTYTYVVITNNVELI